MLSPQCCYPGGIEKPHYWCLLIPLLPYSFLSSNCFSSTIAWPVIVWLLAGGKRTNLWMFFPSCYFQSVLCVIGLWGGECCYHQSWTCVYLYFLCGVLCVSVSPELGLCMVFWVADLGNQEVHLCSYHHHHLPHLSHYHLHHHHYYHHYHYQSTTEVTIIHLCSQSPLHCLANEVKAGSLHLVLPDESASLPVISVAQQIFTGCDCWLHT